MTFKTNTMDERAKKYTDFLFSEIKEPDAVVSSSIDEQGHCWASIKFNIAIQPEQNTNMKTDFIPDGTGYDTHLPVLKFIHETIGIKRAFEFGCGKHSTGFLIGTGADVVSVEMQDEEWFNKIAKEFESAENLIGLYLSLDKYHAIEMFEQVDGHICDLVLVDGHGETRPECVIASLGKADTIVFHDSENEWYGWTERLYKSGKIQELDYSVYSFTQWHPQTTVVTRHPKLISELNKIKRYTINTIC